MDLFLLKAWLEGVKVNSIRKLTPPLLLGSSDRYEEIFDVQMLDTLIAAACHLVH
jgi:hypothetical protein